MFGNCPEYKELTVIIVDKNGNGRFDHIQAIADAYVAGPYVEGPYEIDLPITAAMIARRGRRPVPDVVVFRSTGTPVGGHRCASRHGGRWL